MQGSFIVALSIYIPFVCAFFQSNACKSKGHVEIKPDYNPPKTLWNSELVKKTHSFNDCSSTLLTSGYQVSKTNISFEWYHLLPLNASDDLIYQVSYSCSHNYTCTHPAYMLLIQSQHYPECHACLEAPLVDLTHFSNKVKKTVLSYVSHVASAKIQFASSIKNGFLPFSQVKVTFRPDKKSYEWDATHCLACDWGDTCKMAKTTCMPDTSKTSTTPNTDDRYDVHQMRWWPYVVISGAIIITFLGCFVFLFYCINIKSCSTLAMLKGFFWNNRSNANLSEGGILSSTVVPNSIEMSADHLKCNNWLLHNNNNNNNDNLSTVDESINNQDFEFSMLKYNGSSGASAVGYRYGVDPPPPPLTSLYRVMPSHPITENCLNEVANKPPSKEAMGCLPPLCNSVTSVSAMEKPKGGRISISRPPPNKFPFQLQ